MFVDEIKIYARAGHGGKGCIAFQREKYRPKGGPSGGNGGRGGNVILEADHDLNNLMAQDYQPRLIAHDGQGGLGKGMDGHAGKDLLIKVPCGTMVWRLPSEEGTIVEGDGGPANGKPRLSASSSQRPMIRSVESGQAWEMDLARERDAGSGTEGDKPLGELAADLTDNGQRFILCQGGRGGLGNRNFATATHQTPRFAQPGEPGGEGNYRLELRTMAEIGLVGYPNAGKSTLLTAISRARPKVAPYPFTTLRPNLGIVEFDDFSRILIADIPGIIEDAHENRGLGLSFLRHIERTSTLVYLIELAPHQDRDPFEEFIMLRQELEAYNPEMLEKPFLVALNKIDQEGTEELAADFRAKYPFDPATLFTISALENTNIDPFLEALRVLAQRDSVRFV